MGFFLSEWFLRCWIWPGEDLKGAMDLAYEAVGLIDFHESHFRTDIGAKGLKYGS